MFNREIHEINHSSELVHEVFSIVNNNVRGYKPSSSRGGTRPKDTVGATQRERRTREGQPDGQARRLLDKMRFITPDPDECFLTLLAACSPSPSKILCADFGMSTRCGVDEEDGGNDAPRQRPPGRRGRRPRCRTTRRGRCPRRWGRSGGRTRNGSRSRAHAPGTGETKFLVPGSPWSKIPSASANKSRHSGPPP